MPISPDNIILFVLSHEGGLVNDNDDPGGITNFGISLRFLQSIGLDLNHDNATNYFDIKNITQQDAINIYKKEFWDKFPYGSIENEALVAKVFDAAINIGPKNAIILLQKTINAYFPENKLATDGILGQQTIAMTNRYLKENHYSGCSFINIFECKLIDYYITLAEKNKSLAKFVRGWTRRAKDSYYGNKTGVTGANKTF